MPQLMRYGALVVLLQCLVMAGFVVSLLVNQFGGGESVLESDSAAASYVNIGTAIFLSIIFGFVAWLATQTLRGRPRGQGAIMLIEIILIGVAMYMFRGGAPLMGVATLVTAAFTLLTILHPATRRYAEARYAIDHGRA